ncbi:MAG: glycosyltransferase [Anaerolineales bacterium]|nr:glycosyltransferase [Anaerolineales bacterium]
MPLISIITPSFNQGRFIRQTIESILGQQYPNLELWVIDGGSTDETLSHLRQFETDQRFNWLSEPDHGQSDAINKGLARCQGELCAWINSDDLLLPEALLSLATAWQAGPRPMILYGLARHIDENGLDLGYCAAQSAQMSLEKLLWAGKHVLIQPATFVPTEAFRSVGGVDPAYHYAFDLDLWLKLAEQLPLQFVPHDLALYRLHATSKTVASAPRFIGEFRAILEAAAARGALPARQARGRAELYGMRTYLMPDTLNWAAALRHLWAALRHDARCLPEAVLIFLKAVVRLVIGERRWEQARLAKARLG